MKLTEFCCVLNAKLESVDAQEKARIASLSLQQAFKVLEDEVAFLKVDLGTQSLRFVWPEKLGKSGEIPLRTKNSFAVETYQEKKALLNNRFASKSHSSIFEQVNLEKPKASAEKGKSVNKPKPIQKIMSVPLFKGAEITGVIQVSRKAESREKTGADFTDLQLDALSEIAKIIGKHL